MELCTSLPALRTHEMQRRSREDLSERKASYEGWQRYLSCSHQWLTSAAGKPVGTCCIAAVDCSRGRRRLRRASKSKAGTEVHVPWSMPFRALVLKSTIGF